MAKEYNILIRNRDIFGTFLDSWKFGRTFSFSSLEEALKECGEIIDQGEAIAENLLVVEVYKIKSDVKITSGGESFWLNEQQRVDAEKLKAEKLKKDLL